jgi:hypothetical protein
MGMLVITVSVAATEKCLMFRNGAEFIFINAVNKLVSKLVFFHPTVIIFKRKLHLKV